MRMTGSRTFTRPTVPKMPTGLVELMEGMTKEVLGSNPINVYEFCAAHMKKLLEIRDEPTEKQTLTLEQKISRAQNKIKRRAQERRQKYDKDMQLHCQIDRKDEKLTTDETKDLVTHEINLTKAEVEFSHNENKEIVQNVEAEIVSKETTKNDKNDDEVMNQLENNATNIKITESIEGNRDELFFPEPSTVCIENIVLKDDVNVLENSLASDTFAKETENLIKEPHITESIDSVAVTAEENDITSVENPTDFQRNEQENIEQFSEIYSKITDIEEENINGSLVKNDVSLFNDVTPINSVSNESVSIVDDSSRKNTQNNIAENVDDDIKMNTNLVEDQAATDNHIPTFNIDSTLDDTAFNLPALVDEIVVSAEEDRKNNHEPELGEETNKPSHLDVDTPSTSANIHKNNIESIQNDNRGTNNMDLETAAVTIQKVFRSFLFKSRASHDETSSLEEDPKEANGYSSPNLNNDRRPLGITRMDTMLQTVNEEKSLSLSTDDSSTLSSAATIIQAHIRGFLVRNKLNSNKTASTNSALNSEDQITKSTESETNHDQNKSKTVLNIHIVPDGNIPSLSRDESIMTSMDLSLDGSPPSSINLHPLGYDKSEPRKQLKREDAIQSISPPSNNSGKLSEDIDSAKEILIDDNHTTDYNVASDADHANKITSTPDDLVVKNIVKESLNNITEGSIPDTKNEIKSKRNSLTKMSSDEMDVVTPYTPDANQGTSESSNNAKLMHSGELHDVVLPTNVSRGSTSVVRGE